MKNDELRYGGCETHGQERGSHSSDVFQSDSTVSGENFSLSCYFFRPFFLRKLFSEAVTKNEKREFNSRVAIWLEEGGGSRGVEEKRK